MKNTLPIHIEKIIEEKQKELDKFTLINSPLSIDLNDIDTISRSENANITGIGTELFGNKWFLTEKGEALYRSHPTSKYNDQNIYAWNEIVCQELCKQVDIPCASYDFAHLASSYGVVSYNFLKENEWLVSTQTLFDEYLTNIYTNHTFASYEKLLNSLNPDVYNFDKDEILFNLFKVIVFDYITSQRDRHTNNINFICSAGENNKINLKLAPLFDNEMSFGRFSEKTYKDAMNSPTSVDFCKYLYLCMFQAKTPINEFALQSYNPLVPDINYVWFEDEAKFMLELILSNQRYKDYFSYLLENLNIHTCCETLKQKGLEVSPEKIAWYEKCIDVKKHLLSRAKESLETNITKDTNNNQNDNGLEL